MKDITDDNTGSIEACLCETELCNKDDADLQPRGEISSEENDGVKSDVEPLQTTTKRSLITTLPILGEIVKKSEIINTVDTVVEETPRAGAGFKVSLDTAQSLEDDLGVDEDEDDGDEGDKDEGILCYSCGSLLSPDQTCPTFEPGSSDQIARCLEERQSRTFPPTFCQAELSK